MAASRGHSQSGYSTLSARIAIGLIVLICAELFSGASLANGFWHPWTLIVTYWLYFAHFFFFTTLAVWTGRTSLSSLYLWGVLYGLYESWITKVIWYGYEGNGKFVMGSIGPFGFSEISMVFFLHPIVSFILPLAVTCLLCPALRGTFPDLGWLTGTEKYARWTRVFLFVSFAPVMAMNSGGPINLFLNTLFVVGCMLLFLRLGRAAFQSPEGQPLVVFSRAGFIGLCFYLGLLYGVTYFALRPDGIPSIPVQLLTLALYGLALLGLWRHAKQSASTAAEPLVDDKELHRVVRWFAILLATALALSLLAGSSVLYIPIFVVFVVWTLGGFGLTVVAFVKGARPSQPATTLQRD